MKQLLVFWDIGNLREFEADLSALFIYGKISRKLRMVLILFIMKKCGVYQG